MAEEVLVAATHGPEDEMEVVEGHIRLPNGEEVTRRFLKGKLLGKGGFAKCYLATCMDTDEAYALKVVSKASLQKSSARQRQLKTEVRVHRMLNHKHIVRFEHSFENEDYVYILLQLCPNKSMVELLKRRQRLEECEVRYYLLQLVAAVRHMHGRGVIHRDLKLGNIFLDQDMQCKVGDLGLAAKCGKTERKQTMCGTPNYIAPEILDATGHSFQVDLWSLGVVAYTMLVGRPPYECKDIRSTYKRILANSYCFPPSVPLSEHARHFVRSLLQTKPENRPTLDQVEVLPFLARTSKSTKSSSNSPVSPPGPIIATRRTASETATTRRPLSLRDTNQVHGMQRPPVRQTDPTVVKKATGKAAVDTAAGSKTVRSRKQPLTQQENIPPITTKASTAAPTRTIKAIPSSATATVASVRSPRLPRTSSSRTTSSPSTLTSSTTARPRTISTSPATTTSASLRSRASSSLTPTPSTCTDTLPKRRTPVLSPPQDERPAFKCSPSTKSRGDSTSPPVKAATRSPPVKAVAAVRKVAAPTADKVEDRARRRVPTEARKEEAVVNQHGLRRRPQPEEAKQPEPRSVAAQARTVPAARATPEQPVDPLELIHRRLTRFLNEAEQQRADRPSSRPTRTQQALPPSLETLVPTVWIERYCDFSTKYGIGFLLNNGCAGVHFNDSTKIVVDPQGEEVTYTERFTRQRTPDKGPSAKTHTVTRFSLDDYPEELHKKVTLLQHFRKFLLQGGGTKGSSVPSSKKEVDEQQDIDDGFSGPVYVRKWARTSLALVFRLNNRVLQIIFNHGEEVLITEDARVLTHVDGLGVRTSYSLGAMLEAPSSSIVKRLQFANRLIEELRRT